MKPTREQIFQALDRIYAAKLNPLHAAERLADVYGLTRFEARQYIKSWLREFSTRHPADDRHPEKEEK